MNNKNIPGNPSNPQQHSAESQSLSVTTVTTPSLMRVDISEFNVRQLRQAAREGRLFVAPAILSPEEEQERCSQAILRYVSAIDRCSSPQYCGTIQSLWRSIVHHPQLRPLLMMRQGRHRGQPNKYRVTAIATILLNRGVYRSEFTAVDLHLRLEKTTRRNVYYTSMDKYYPNTSEMAVIRQLIRASCEG